MTRPRTFYAGLGIVAVAGSVIAASAGTALARITVLDDDAPTIARAIAPRPDGGPGLRLEDNLFQVASTPTVLPPGRVASRLSGGAPTVSAPSLLGRSPAGMAELLRARVRSSGAHRVFVDDLGPEFGGSAGDDLAQALDILSGETAPYAPTGIARRVNLYAPDPGHLLSDPAWAGARRAITRSGGVWLKTFGAESEWSPSEWLAWPVEAASQLQSGGSSRGRVHVVFTGRGHQAAAWSLARAGSACAILANGPGGYHLGADVDAFVAEHRRTLNTPSADKLPPAGCTTVPALTAAGARGLDAATGLEAAGVEIPPGGLVTPPLPAGEPAQITVQLGSDPFGLAKALGVSPETFWSNAQARLQVSGPGIQIDAILQGDGAAHLDFTPSAPGPLTMRVLIDQSAVTRVLGGEADIVGPLHSARVSAALIGRVVADPSGWQLDIPLMQPGGAPGSPVLEIVPPPT